LEYGSGGTLSPSDVLKGVCRTSEDLLYRQLLELLSGFAGFSAERFI
jgi:hypothetical protein